MEQESAVKKVNMKFRGFFSPNRTIKLGNRGSASTAYSLLVGVLLIVVVVGIKSYGTKLSCSLASTSYAASTAFDQRNILTIQALTGCEVSSNPNLNGIGVCDGGTCGSERPTQRR